MNFRFNSSAPEFVPPGFEEHCNGVHTPGPGGVVMNASDVLLSIPPELPQEPSNKVHISDHSWGTKAPEFEPPGLQEVQETPTPTTQPSTPHTDTQSHAASLKERYGDDRQLGREQGR